MQRLKIAVIGSGISGMAAAWLLSKRHDVTLMDAEARPGGHSNTVLASGPWGECAVDTGFIVYNTQSYPNLVALFDHLGVETAASNMSFSVSIDRGRYEYSGTGLGGIFGQPSNALKPHHWRLLLDVRRFFDEARDAAENGIPSSRSLGAFLCERSYSQVFIDRHILPMAAAIWSCAPADVLGFPLTTFVRFFSNHGLLQVKNRPEWRTVVGGSRRYVNAVLDDFQGQLDLRRAVISLRREAGGVVLTDHLGHNERFDACVLASHADASLDMLADPDEDERDVLACFRYQENAAILHTDPSVMPRRQRVWSSWNFVCDGSDRRAPPSVTYWMNRLQPLHTTQHFFVSLNPSRPIAEGAEIARFAYDHPVFDQAAIDAQQRLWALQGRRRTWFCGSYFGYGFHEDGLQSGLAVAEALGGVRRPWRVENESGRIHVGPSPVLDAESVAA